MLIKAVIRICLSRFHLFVWIACFQFLLLGRSYMERCDFIISTVQCTCLTLWPISITTTANLQSVLFLAQQCKCHHLLPVGNDEEVIKCSTKKDGSHDGVNIQEQDQVPSSMSIFSLLAHKQKKAFC